MRQGGWHRLWGKKKIFTLAFSRKPPSSSIAGQKMLSGILNITSKWVTAFVNNFANSAFSHNPIHPIPSACCWWMWIVLSGVSRHFCRTQACTRPAITRCASNWVPKTYNWWKGRLVEECCCRVCVIFSNVMWPDLQWSNPWLTRQSRS